VRVALEDRDGLSDELGLTTKTSRERKERGSDAGETILHPAAASTAAIDGDSFGRASIRVQTEPVAKRRRISSVDPGARPCTLLSVILEHRPSSRRGVCPCPFQVARIFLASRTVVAAGPQQR
jgi:hypothetical protein